MRKKDLKKLEAAARTYFDTLSPALREAIVQNGVSPAVWEQLDRPDSSGPKGRKAGPRREEK